MLKAFVFIFLFFSYIFYSPEVHATTFDWIPYDIVVQEPGEKNTILTPNQYSLNNLTYWSFPPNFSSDYTAPAKIYFRYNNGNSDYCVYQGNNGRISGTFYSDNGFRDGTSVSVQDRSISSRPYFTCESNINGQYMTFTCNNLNLSHNYNFIIIDAAARRYSIRQQFDVDCQLTNEGVVSQVIDNANSNTDKIIKNQNENSNKINDSITSEESPDINSDFWNDIYVDKYNPVSNLITMPITLLQAYLNGFNSTCEPFVIGELFDYNIVFPCINLEKYLGSTLWTSIDVLFTIFMVYELAMLFISIYEGITSLDDFAQMLYSPRHGNMSRVGRGHSEGLY